MSETITKDSTCVACQDCRHHLNQSIGDRCIHPSQTKYKLNVITGKSDITHAGWCNDMRADENYCGLDAKLFEPKED